MTTTAVSPLPVLLVDDAPALLRSASLLLRAAGIAPVLTLDDPRQVLPRLAAEPFGGVVLALTMPHLAGQALLEQIPTTYPSVHTLVMTATHDLATAVQCMQAGALDYLVKPVDKHRLVTAVRRALELSALRRAVDTPPAAPGAAPPPPAFADLVTQNPPMHTPFCYVAPPAPPPPPPTL